MGMKIALCQLASSEDYIVNLERMESAISDNEADLYLFPEMYLTKYGNPHMDSEDRKNAIEWMKSACAEKDIALAVGMPMEDFGEISNSLLFVTPNEIYRYDKLFLANFPPYDEGVFTKGSRPVMVEWKGFKIGLEICYDIMFPELHRYYAKNGADLILVSSASAESSRYAFGTIAPARSLENTVYTVFCNNIGMFKDLRLFGGSCLYSPMGELYEGASRDEEVLVVEVKKPVIAEARKIRHHLVDIRDDIPWSE